MENPTAPIQKVTFNLSDVEPAQTLLNEISYREALELCIMGGLEGCSHHADALVFAGCMLLSPLKIPLSMTIDL